MEDIGAVESDFPWLLLERSFPGIPMKHFVDHFARFGAAFETDINGVCEAFFNDFRGQRCNNEIMGFDPEVCPAFPNRWNSWHDPIDVSTIKEMPLKTSFRVDLINHVKNPQMM